MLDLRFSNQFKKDYKLMQKRKVNLSEFETVVNLLRNEIPLPAKYKDHSLSGNYSNHRDCHLAPDLILIYTIKRNELILEMVRLGSHSDLFE